MLHYVENKNAQEVKHRRSSTYEGDMFRMVVRNLKCS